MEREIKTAETIIEEMISNANFNVADPSETFTNMKFIGIRAAEAYATQFQLAASPETEIIPTDDVEFEKTFGGLKDLISDEDVLQWYFSLIKLWGEEKAKAALRSRVEPASVAVSEQTADVSIVVHTREQGNGRYWCNATIMGIDKSFEGLTINSAVKQMKEYLDKKGINNSEVEWLPVEYYKHDPPIPKPPIGHARFRIDENPHG